MRSSAIRLGILFAFILGCSGEVEPIPAAAPIEAAPLSVYTVNAPLAYFAERIGGALVRVSLPTPADVDPASWSPAPDVVAQYQAADLILLNGAGYAGWVARATLPRAAQVDTSASFSEKLIARASAVSHIHGPTGDHSHAEIAFTTWLDPLLALEQARAVSQALARARPEHAASFEQNTVALEADLRALDTRLAAAAAQLHSAPLLFSHPVYAYLQRRYQLNARSLHWEPDEAPSERQWRELSDLLGEHPAQVLLWEAEPLTATRERLQSQGVQSVVYAPAGNRSDAGDWLKVMQTNAEQFEALSGSEAQ
jgi:zinc transport system substrate-binding protein